MQQPPNQYPQYPQQQWQQPPMPPQQQWNQQQPYPPQQYQQPPQYQSPMPPPKKKSRKPMSLGVKIGIGAGLLLLVLLIIVAAAIDGNNNVNTANSQATQAAQDVTGIAKDNQSIATVAVTQTALAVKKNQLLTQIAQVSTPTKAPATNLAVTHGTPRLGGPISDFIGAYGQPNSHSNPGGYAGQYHFQRDTNTTDVTDGLIVSTSADSKSSVDDITVAAVAQNATYNDPQAGSSFSPSDAKTKCMTFAPSDAHFVKEFVYADNTGFDMVYTSVSLAQSFPAGDFTDSQSNQVQAGMFDVSYLYKSNGDTQHIDSCDMIIGEQQTAN